MKFISRIKEFFQDKKANSEPSKLYAKKATAFGKAPLRTYVGDAFIVYQGKRIKKFTVVEKEYSRQRAEKKVSEGISIEIDNMRRTHPSKMD